MQGNDEQPDSLILNHLPFAEDLRVAKFASLDENPDLVPSFSQLEKMRSVVQALDLKTGEHFNHSRHCKRMACILHTPMRFVILRGKCTDVCLSW